jgi:hypothetical protein
MRSNRINAGAALLITGVFLALVIFGVASAINAAIEAAS